MAEIQHFRLGDAVAAGQNIAMNNFKLGQAQRQQQAQTGLTEAMQVGTPEAMTQYSQQFPQEAAAHQESQIAMRQKQLSDAILNIDVMDRLLDPVLQAPPEQQQPLYAQALQTMKEAGMDTSQMPQMFDPNMAAQKKQEAAAMRQTLAAQMGGSRSQVPASVQETQWYSQQPKNVQDTHVMLKRAPSIINLGGQQVVRDPRGGIAESYETTLKPDQRIPYIEEKQRTQEQAKLDAKKEEGRSKASLAMENAKQRADRVIAAIDRAIPRVNSWTAGLAGASLNSIGGTPARDLRADIDTIRANIGFDELNAMRQASPTGGALGQVSERELAFLQSVLTNLEQSQSPAQLRRNLELAKQEIKDSWERVRRAYEADYAVQQQPTPTPSSAAQPVQTQPKSKYSNLWE